MKGPPPEFDFASLHDVPDFMVSRFVLHHPFRLMLGLFLKNAQTDKEEKVEVQSLRLTINKGGAQKGIVLKERTYSSLTKIVQQKFR